MESRFRVAGNGVQPLLLMFPWGLFTLAAIFDVATLAGAPHLLATTAYWHIVAGLTGGTLAVPLASLALRPGPATLGGTAGVLLDLFVLILFAVVALIRLRTPDRGVESGLLLVEGFGLVAAGAGTWLGGRLGPLRVPRTGPESPPGPP